MPALNLDVNDLIKASLHALWLISGSLRESRALDRRTVIRCKFVCHPLIELHEFLICRLCNFTALTNRSKHTYLRATRSHLLPDPLVGQSGHFITFVSFQAIALFPLSTPFQQDAIVQFMKGVAAREVFARGRLATREVLIACNRVPSQSVKPCLHFPSSPTHSRLWFTRGHTTRPVLRTFWLFVWLVRLKKRTIENHMEIWQDNKSMPTTCGVRRSLMSITDPCLID